MLLGLDPVLSADLLHALAAMGHGDRLALVDANYPATRGRRLICLHGIDMPRALQAVLSVLPISRRSSPTPAPACRSWASRRHCRRSRPRMNAVLVRHGLGKPAASLERHAFYAAAESAYAIVQTGERRFYGNILLTKGVCCAGETRPDRLQPMAPSAPVLSRLTDKSSVIPSEACQPAPSEVEAPGVVEDLFLSMRRQE